MRPIATGLSIALLSVATASSAIAQPHYSATQGYLDFIGATAGAPAAAGFATGPYRATFGPTQATLDPKQFDIFCIDWLGRAGDAKVKLLTFSQAVTSAAPIAAALRNKYADDPNPTLGGTVGGLTVAKLNSAAWLTKQMTVANKTQWNEMHVALWNIFWDTGLGSPALPALSFLQDGQPGIATDLSAQSWYNSAMLHAGDAATDYRVVASYTTANVCTGTGANRVCSVVETFDPSKQVFLVSSVPEPGTYALMSAGLLALAGAARRRRAKSASRV